MIHLHTHSMYSLRDSIIKPSELAERLVELGQDTVAITDHGGSLGGVTIYKTLREHNIRYIHGVEFYICDDVSVKEKGSKYYHLIALCKNDVGRVNMNRLITISEHPDNKYYKPRIDFGILQEHKDGLIIMSACIAGEVSQALMAGDREQAKRIVQRYKAVFGEDYYLEIQSHRTEDQEKLNVAIISLAKELDIPFVVTCDAHYVREGDAKYQSKYAFNGAYKEDGETYLDCFIQSEDEVRQKLWYLNKADVEQAIEETHRIADKCRLEMPLSDPIMPKIDTPGKFESNKQWLHWLCADGFRTKLRVDLDAGAPLDDCTLTTESVKKYIERYYYEMNALEKMGFIDYILLVYSYSNVGKRRGIARGSGGGSLINYLTNITNIDPIEHGLYFERFIDVGALPKLESGEITAKELKVPDIDLDFSGESCKEVLHFLYDTYGEERVASIGKFGTNKTKGTIRDMARVFGIDLQTADQIAKSFESYEIDEVDAMISGEMETSFDATDAIRHVKNYPELFEYVRKLNGLPKSFGLHSCGKVISTRDLDDFLPSCYDTDGVRYLQGDMHDVEDVGLVKIDVLGLRTLDQEYDTLEMSGETPDFIDPRQSYDDPKVLDVFRKKDTLGIFQMSSYGMKQTLAQMQVSGIDDLSVANALYRPGSMGYIDNYCRRKAGKETFEYLHPDLEPILKSTYGIIVFQEQLIEIGRMAGLHNPDLLRKATGKKNPQLLAEIKPELEGKLKNRGWSQEQFDQLWTDMLEFAKYSFNKSHAAAYAIIAYMTAKQKAYYPAEFFAGLCNSYIGHSAFVKDEADEILADAARHGVLVAPFDFRDDHRKCSVKDGRIVWAIPLIRDCNTAMAEALYEFRNTTEPKFWRLAKQLDQAGVKPAGLTVLVQLGFFSEYGDTRKLLRILEVATKHKFGERISVKKSNLPPGEPMTMIVERHSTDRNAKGEVLKTYKLTDCAAIIDECENYIRSFPESDIDFKSRIAYQKEMLGFVSLLTGKQEDRPKLFVKSIAPVKRKRDGRQFGWGVITQSIGSGIETRFTIFNNVFNKEPITEGDIILCRGYERDGQYFTMTSYEKIFF